MLNCPVREDEGPREKENGARSSEWVMACSGCIDIANAQVKPEQAGARADHPVPFGIAEGTLFDAE